MNIFKLTNGTTTVNFLSTSPTGGVLIQDWSPAVAEYKGGGVVVDNPVMSGRRLVLKRWEWPIESVDFAIHRSTQAQVLADIKELEGLLVQASNYWDESHHENDPVWLETRFGGESQSKYALVLDGRITNRPNPFAQPFGTITGQSSTDIMTLSVMRSHWQDNIPGNLNSSIAEQTASYSNSPAADISQPTDSNGWVYVGSRHNPVNNIYQVRTYGAGGTGLSGNVYTSLTDYFVDWTVGDYVEFTSTDPFLNVVLDVGNPASAALGFTVEYYDSGDTVWRTIPTTQIHDGTFGFTRPGMISWNIYNLSGGGYESDEATQVRITLSNTNSVLSSPGRNNSAFREFEANYPYVTLPTRTAGTIPDALKISVRTATYDHRVIGGSRSVSRGSGFVSTINITDVAGYNPAYITVTETTANTSFSTTIDSLSVTNLSTSGYVVEYDGSALSTSEANASEMFVVTVDSSYASHFRGRFRAIVRAATDGVGDNSLFRFKLRVETGSPGAENYVESEVGELSSDFGYIDMGVVSIYDQKTLAIGSSGDLIFTLLAWQSESGTLTSIGFYELVLLPVDEIYFEHDNSFAYTLSVPPSEPIVLVVDDATDPARDVLYYAENDDGDYLSSLPKIISRPVTSESGAESRLYFFAVENEEVFNHVGRENAFGVKVGYVKRYLTVS